MHQQHDYNIYHPFSTPMEGDRATINSCKNPEFCLSGFSRRLFFSTYYLDKLSFGLLWGSSPVRFSQYLSVRILYYRLIIFCHITCLILLIIELYLSRKIKTVNISSFWNSCRYVYEWLLVITSKHFFKLIHKCYLSSNQG